MTVIELGDLSSGSAPDAGQPRRVDRRLVRRTGIAVLVLLVLLGVTGSARPAPRGIPARWSIPFTATDYAVTPDSVYVIEPGIESTLTAYRLSDGARRWTRTLTDQTPWVNTDVSGALLVPAGAVTVRVTADDGSVFAQEYMRDTVALDPMTGRDLWRHRGEWSAMITGDSALLTEWNPTGRGLHRLWRVGLRDGAQAWAYTPRRPVRTWSVLRDRVIAVDTTGAVEVIALADGSVTRPGRLPWAVTDGSDGTFDDLLAVGDTLAVVHGGASDGSTTTTAYDAVTLARRWQLTGPLSGGTFPCGELLCVGSSRRIVAYDPVSGAARWRSTGWDYARPVGGGRLLASDQEGNANSVIEAATGRVLADLGRGTAVLDPVAGTLLELRPAVAPAGIAVHRFDAADGLLLRGLIPPLGDSGCRASGRYLVCDMADRTLAVRDVG